MPTYERYEKKTSGGVLACHLALDGKILLIKRRRKVARATGRIAAGFDRSRLQFGSAAHAKAAYEQHRSKLLDERYTRVGAKSVRAPASSREAMRLKGRVRRCTPARLARFEKLRGVRLPASYKAFVARFGAGEVLGFVRIHAPGAKRGFALERLTDLVESSFESRGSFVPFADTGGGDVLGWRLGRRSGSKSEPAIILWPLSARPRRIARSFTDLVTRLTSDQRFVDRVFLGLGATGEYQCR